MTTDWFMVLKSVDLITNSKSSAILNTPCSRSVRKVTIICQDVWYNDDQLEPGHEPLYASKETKISFIGKKNEFLCRYLKTGPFLALRYSPGLHNALFLWIHKSSGQFGEFRRQLGRITQKAVNSHTNKAIPMCINYELRRGGTLDYHIVAMRSPLSSYLGNPNFHFHR